MDQFQKYHQSTMQSNLSFSLHCHVTHKISQVNFLYFQILSRINKTTLKDDEFKVWLVLIELLLWLKLVKDINTVSWSYRELLIYQFLNVNLVTSYSIWIRFPVLSEDFLIDSNYNINTQKSYKNINMT